VFFSFIVVVKYPRLTMFNDVMSGVFIGLDNYLLERVNAVS